MLKETDAVGDGKALFRSHSYNALCMVVHCSKGSRITGFTDSVSLKALTSGQTSLLSPVILKYSLVS